MPLTLQHDKSILITGCSSGIGRCVALALRERGYTVFPTARTMADVETLRNAGFAAYQVDLTDVTSMTNGVQAILARTGGRLYALFNNGAYGQPGAVEDLSIEALKAQFEGNFFGTHCLTRMIIPVMRAQGYGRIIQNSSILGFVALRYRGAYVASKYALEGLTDALRLELSGSGVYVTLIEPGPVVSQFRENALRAFQRWIDAEGSIHKLNYERMQAERFTNKPTKFSVPPEAVLKRVIHALESRQPKARYPVTLPTYLFVALKRVLPTKLLDRILRVAG